MLQKSAMFFTEVNSGGLKKQKKIKKNIYMFWIRLRLVVKVDWKEVRQTAECLLLPANRWPSPSPF